MNSYKKEVLALNIELKPLIREVVFNNVEELVEADEWGVAFEAICTELHETSAKISKANYDNLVKTGSSFGIDESYWLILQPQVIAH